MKGDKVTEEIKEIPLSADTLCRRIGEMSQDIECQLIDRVKQGKYALQLDEYADKSGLAQLMVFVRYIANGKLEEELLMCVALSGTFTGKDIFSAVNTRLHNQGLLWECCISICTDGAGAVVGKHTEFLARVSQIAPHINFTHCIIHKKNLASKTLDQQLKCVLDSAAQIVNYIKSRLLQTIIYHLFICYCLFTILCDERGSEHITLLFHSEVRWLSQRRVLTRLYELQNKAYLFLTERRHELPAKLTNPDWLT